MSYKILIIEDHKDVRNNIAEILEGENFHVYLAENGEIGVETARKTQPDLILCDIMMPGMSGYEVLKHLRKHALTSSIPFIFLTAKNTREDQRLGMQLGADDFISKPFTIEELLSAVTTRINRLSAIRHKGEEKLHDLTEQLGLPIARNIREPLRAIISFSEMIMAEYPQMEKSEISEFVALIHKSGKKLESLVAKTVLYYQLEALRLDEEKLAVLKKQRGFDTKIIVEGIIEQIGNEYFRKDDIKVVVDDCNPIIDKAHFSVLIHELTENAILFSPKGSMIKLVLTEEKGRVLMTFTDEGIGITEEQISKISAFNQFLDNDSKGIGLGLTLVNKIVDLFNGSFSISGTPGMGSKAIVSLPAY